MIRDVEVKVKKQDLHTCNGLRFHGTNLFRYGKAISMHKRIHGANSTHPELVAAQESFDEAEQQSVLQSGW